MGRKRSKSEETDDKSEEEESNGYEDDDYEESSNEKEYSEEEESDHSLVDTDVDTDETGLTDIGIPSNCYWAYLLINLDSKLRVHTYIGRSRDPIKKCKKKNAVVKTPRPKDEEEQLQNPDDAGERELDLEETLMGIKNKMKKNYWTIELVIGPFKSKQKAEEFKTQWRMKSRGVKSRKIKGKKLASCFDGDKLRVWDARVASKNV